MLKAYCDGGGDYKTKKFYGSYFVEGCEVVRLAKLPVETTNEAEYQTLIELLQFLIRNKIKDVEIYSDSMLVVSQVNKKWRIKKHNLIPFCVEATILLSKLENVSLQWTSRDNIVKVLGH